MLCPLVKNTFQRFILFQVLSGEEVASEAGLSLWRFSMGPKAMVEAAVAGIIMGLQASNSSRNCWSTKC